MTICAHLAKKKKKDYLCTNNVYPKSWMAIYAQIYKILIPVCK